MKKNNKVLMIGLLIIIVILIVALIIIKQYGNIIPDGESKLKLEDLTDFKNDIYSQYYSNIQMMDIHPSVLEDIYMIDSRMYVSYVGKIPKTNTDSSMYIIFKAIKGKETELEGKLKEYLQIHIARWNNLTEQKKLAEAAQIGIKGDTVYLIIGKDAKKIASLL
jgi:hypothetical protein